MTEPPEKVLWSEPGPFGEFWWVLIRPSARAELVYRLKQLQSADPEQLWRALATQPVPQDLIERVTAWSVLQFWSFAGKLVYAHNPAGNQTTIFETPLRWKTHGFARANAYNGEYRAARGEGTGRADIRLDKVIERLESLPSLRQVDLWCGAAQRLEVPLWTDKQTLVLIDPPYRRALTYGRWAFSRNDVENQALRWSETGATVLIFEREAILMPEGWDSINVTAAQKGRGRTFAPTDEWVTHNLAA